MYLLEHDAKALLAERGIGVPDGRLVAGVAALDSIELPPGPWMVKAQVAAGGRGKAGAVRRAATRGELRAHLAELLVMQVKGQPVRECRIETAVSDALETYLGFIIDASAGGVRALLAPRGGVDVESLADLRKSEPCAPEPAQLGACAEQLASGLAEPLRGALADAGRRLATFFVEHECTLLEINPLFVRPDGGWIAGDAKIITDDDALFRQPRLRELLEHRGEAYPAAARKLAHGCDYVVVDPDGELGLLTTGAGLSMMLIDELRASGIRPYNFLDVRTGGLRGDPTRLVHVLDWIADGARVKAVLVNVFAGITDLGEFARLLLEALGRTRLRVPVVTRLVGTGLDDARAVLARAGIEVETDLSRAIASVRKYFVEPRTPGDRR
ncbi:MAG TPA: ATP-grasp domain-containing protein [Burkholderiales bacterium]|nr:ATP-grasp domain-containing protein [Burkholderiales bacterium]